MRCSGIEMPCSVAWPNGAKRPTSPIRMMPKKLVGVVGSGQIGHDPFDRKCWSGSSYYFFSQLQQQGMLHRAFGAEISRIKSYFLLAKNFRCGRRSWRENFYMDPSYRDALTATIGNCLVPSDFDHDFLQLGAMFAVPSLLHGRNRCYSYHDGNLAEVLRSPNAPRGVTAGRIAKALTYEKQTYHAMSKIFTMSEYLRQSFINDFDLPPGRVVTIGAGINLEHVPKPDADKRFDTEEILFIGIDFQRKGGWDLLRAFREVRERFPNARLHLVGPPTLKIPAELHTGVFVHGTINKYQPDGRAKLADLFRRCCLFVMPSLYEPFGIAPLEAMVHQIPCILTNRWAFKEMVIPGENGDLVECGAVEELTSKITSLLADPPRLQRMGNNGRQRVLNYYTWNKVIERLIEAVSN